MREIKFRAWSKTYKRMIMVWSIDFNNDALNGYFEGDKEHLDNWVTQPKPIEKGVLMQFTGLHDKNGKEIYEGDIVDLISDGICEVRCYQNGQGMYSFAPFHSKYGKYAGFPANEKGKVIGNIYENPELLK